MCLSWIEDVYKIYLCFFNENNNNKKIFGWDHVVSMIKRVAYMLSSIVPCQQNDLWLTTIIALSLHIKVTWQVC